VNVTRLNFHLAIAALFFMPYAAAAVPTAQKQQINSAIAENDWDTAEDVAKDLTKQFARDAEAHYLLALAIRNKMENVSNVRALMNIGDYKEALETAIQLDSAHVDARTEQIGYLIHAPGVAGGDRQEAAKKIQELQAISALDAARMSLQLASAEQNPNQQLEALDRLISLEPDNKRHLITKGIILMNQKQYEASDAVLAEAATTAEEQIALSALYQRARWRILAKQASSESEQWLRDYIDRYPKLENTQELPDLSAAYWRLGLALELSGDEAAALKALQTSVCLLYTSPSPRD